MFGEPLMADESQIRRPTAFVTPRKLREGTENSNPGDNPHDVHRQVPFVLLFTTIESTGSRADRVCETAQSHSDVRARLPPCLQGTAIGRDSTRIENANYTIASEFTR